MHSAASLVSVAGRYVHWGVVQISVTNLVIVLAMILVFVLALVVPFPGHHDTRSGGRR